MSLETHITLQCIWVSMAGFVCVWGGGGFIPILLLHHCKCVSSASQNRFSTNKLSLHKIANLIMKGKLQNTIYFYYFTSIEQLWNKIIIWHICWDMQTSFREAAIAKSTVTCMQSRTIPLIYFFFACMYLAVHQHCDMIKHKIFLWKAQ